jgi:uncharacterized protein YdbL (DUF1318 family)
MLNRRGLIGMLASSPVTAPAAMKTLVDEAMAGDDAGNTVSSYPQEVACGPPRVQSWDVIEHIQFQYRREAEIGCQTIHPSISQKKSWSTAFKAHCHAEREKEYRELERRLRESEAMVEKVAKALGIRRGA